ncbi:MAG: hypothetical protein COV76_00655 [Candidatus Omnitrophica bacterium CG11_big_fil_rev_8_21_14_0_20_64_10]|nr:MAG: hypothetical protein COV76_00655 [Candidatus Omnitrophica bacterium CG11_big_fil_rev_8_21_14_0_20_64_10]
MSGRWGLVSAALGALWVGTALAAEPLLIDDFEAAGRNRLGGKGSTYTAEPSRSLALRREGEGRDGSAGLLVRYDKKNTGGPYGQGGWCGYYTLLKSGRGYLDATPYQAVVLWVKGAQGGENFVLGLADKHWDEVGDSVKSGPIGKYLPSGGVTTEWQKASVPLNEFSVNVNELASLAVCFEGSLFPDGSGKGGVYLDDLSLE